MKHIIDKIYLYDTHRNSDKPNAISTTTLIGSMYKAKLALDKTPRNPSLIPLMYKRSSSIGTAFHEYAEAALKSEDNWQDRYALEEFRERQVELDGIVYTISGSSDGIEKQKDGTWTIWDIKTQYGRSRAPQMLDKDRLQLSIYRWLFENEYNINDTGYILAVSQSNNWEDAIPVELMSLEQTQNYIEEKLYAIINNTIVDCNVGIKYSACQYCDIANCSERKV